MAPLQVPYYSEALPTQHGYCAGISLRIATGSGKRETPKEQYITFHTIFV